MAQDLICGKPKKEKGWDDHWTSFEHPDLPQTVRIHGGNACIKDPDNWDNTWIEWADQHVDVPTDKRCFGEEDEYVDCYVKI